MMILSSVLTRVRVRARVRVRVRGITGLYYYCAWQVFYFFLFYYSGWTYYGFRLVGGINLLPGTG